MRIYCLLLAFIAVGCARQETFVKLTAHEDRLVVCERQQGELNKRLSDLETQLKSNITGLRQRNADANAGYDELKSDLQQLRGLLEVQSHDLADLMAQRKQQQPAAPAVTQADLEAFKLRIKTLEDLLAAQQLIIARLESEQRKPKAEQTATPPAAPAVVAPSAVAQGQPAQPPAKSQSVQAARDYLAQGDFPKALETAKSLLKSKNDGPDAPELRYLIAEAEFGKKNYLQAISDYQEVLDKHPTSALACPSALQQGLSFKALLQPAEAKLFLSDALKKCPKDSAEARLAAEELQKLNAAPQKKPAAKRNSKSSQNKRR